MERGKSRLFKSLEAEVGVTSYVIADEVGIKLRELIGKIQSDLAKGFTYFELNGFSYSVVYCEIPNGAKFVVSKTFCKGRMTRETVWEEYLTSFGKISIIIGKPTDDVILNCSVYLDGNLIAGGKSKNNPYGIALKALESYKLSEIDVGKTKFIFKR